MKTFTSIPALAIPALMIAGPASAASITDIDTIGSQHCIGNTHSRW